MKKVPIIAIAAFMMSANIASAQNLSAAQISDLIVGKEVLLATKWGAFPLRYSSKNEVFGDGSGVGLAKFFAPKETGQWWFASDQLCQKFPTWYKGKTFCFTLQQRGENKLSWVRDDGYRGIATVK